MTAPAELERVTVLLGDRGLLDDDLMHSWSPEDVVSVCEEWAARVGIVARGAAAVGIATGNYPGLLERLLERRRTLAILQYHVPRSQVWEGSRGRTRGNVHVRLREEFRSGRIRRRGGETLCGRTPWYGRAPEPDELADLCPRCVDLAGRHRIPLPSSGDGLEPSPA